MKSLARSLPYSFEDAPTAEIETLGSLVITPAMVVLPMTTVDEVRHLLVEYRVPAIVVVDENEHILGVVTRTDVLRTQNGATAVTEAMSGFVFAVPVRSSIERVAALIAFEGVGQVVVIGACGELLGMVSAVDIARHYAIEAGYLVD